MSFDTRTMILAGTQNGNEKVIASPVRDRRRATIRCVLEMVAQAHPVTASLAHLYGYTHPSQFEQGVEKFWTALAASASDHEERLSGLEACLAPRLGPSAEALEVLTWLLDSNTTGLCEPIVFDELTNRFPGLDRKVLEEAVAELCHLGYATKSSTIGYPIRSVRLTADAFVSSVLGPIGHDEVFQTTAAVQPGNSGGPIVDAGGRVIRVVVARLDPAKGQNIGWAIRRDVVVGFAGRFGIRLTDASGFISVSTTAFAREVAAYTYPVGCFN